MSPDASHLLKCPLGPPKENSTVSLRGADVISLNVRVLQRHCVLHLVVAGSPNAVNVHVLKLEVHVL